MQKEQGNIQWWTTTLNLTNRSNKQQMVKIELYNKIVFERETNLTVIWTIRGRISSKLALEKIYTFRPSLAEQ